LRSRLRVSRTTLVLSTFALAVFASQARHVVPRAPRSLAPAEYFERYPHQWFEEPANGARRRLERSLAAVDRRVPRSASLLVGACPATPEVEAEADRQARGLWAAYLSPRRDVRRLRQEWLTKGIHVLCTEGALSPRKARRLAVLPTGHRLFRVR
jgi:hypothetical protein